MAYTAWVEGEDPEIGDGVLWNAPTAEDAADMHVDEHVIPRWADYGHCKSVVVCVREYDEGQDVERFSYDIDMEPVRGFCTRIGSSS